MVDKGGVWRSWVGALGYHLVDVAAQRHHLHLPPHQLAVGEGQPPPVGARHTQQEAVLPQDEVLAQQPLEHPQLRRLQRPLGVRREEAARHKLRAGAPEGTKGPRRTNLDPLLVFFLSRSTAAHGPPQVGVTVAMVEGQREPASPPPEHAT